MPVIYAIMLDIVLRYHVRRNMDFGDDMMAVISWEPRRGNITIDFSPMTLYLRSEEFVIFSISSIKYKSQRCVKYKIFHPLGVSAKQKPRPII